MSTFVLVHSPLVGPFTWSLVSDELAARGVSVALRRWPGNSGRGYWRFRKKRRVEAKTYKDLEWRLTTAIDRFGSYRVDERPSRLLVVRARDPPAGRFAGWRCGAGRKPMREAAMALAMMQKGNLDAVQSDVHGRIAKETVALEGVSVTRVVFHPGARWSEDLKAYAGTESCELPHVAVVLSGMLHVVMDDGSDDEFSTNDVMMLPPGHDAWCVGDEPCVFVEFSRGNDYYALS